MKNEYRTVVKWAETFNETTSKVYLSAQKPHITLIGGDSWSSHIHIDFGDQVLMVKSQSMERMETTSFGPSYGEEDF